MTIDFSNVKFAIIKHRGDLDNAETADGHRVHRQERVIFRGRQVLCASYDNHFIFNDPSFNKVPFRWFAMCSCGSPAVVVGYNAYKKDASPSSGDGLIPGEMAVCYFHANSGTHADGSS